MPDSQSHDYLLLANDIPACCLAEGITGEEPSLIINYKQPWHIISTYYLPDNINMPSHIELKDIAPRS